MENKEFWREIAKRTRDELTDRREKDCKIKEKVIELLCGSSGNIFIYCSMGSEVDTSALAASLYDGFSLYVPHASQGRMTPIKLDSLERMSAINKWGNAYSEEEAKSFFSQPCSDKPNMDIAIVPMLAFDSSLRRLGYGGGYYDRFLPDANCLSVGLAYDEQQNDRIDFFEYDIPMDIIVTPTRILRR